jgi:hypothetical protein
VYYPRTKATKLTVLLVRLKDSFSAALPPVTAPLPEPPSAWHRPALASFQLFELQVAVALTVSPFTFILEEEVVLNVNTNIFNLVIFNTRGAAMLLELVPVSVGSRTRGSW